MFFSSYHIIETIIYTILSLLPYIFLALRPFYDSLRFSKPITALLVSILMVSRLQVLLLLLYFQPHKKGFLIFLVQLLIVYFIL